MKKSWIKYIVCLTLLLAGPIIYQYSLYPAYGFATAFLLAWLMVEDFFELTIDLRVAFCFMAVIMLWQKPLSLALASWAFFFFAAEAMRFAQAIFFAAEDMRFAQATYQPGTIKGDRCPLQDGCFTGFVPLLGAAVFIVLFADMVYNPLALLKVSAVSGNSLAGVALDVHESAAFLKELFLNNIYLTLLPVAVAGLLVAGFRFRAHLKKAKGLVAVYPMGDGDAFVLASLSALLGPEVFSFVVFPLTLVLGETLRIYVRFRHNKGAKVA